MKKEDIEQIGAPEVIRVNLKMNVLCGMINNCETLYGYCLGALLYATNGKENGYEDSYEIAEVLEDGILGLFQIMENHPELRGAMVETETENFIIEIATCECLNDLDIYCTKIL